MNRLQNFLSTHKIISTSQHGFQKDKSIESGLFEFISKVTDAINKEQLAVGLFIDLSKAFDMVNHSILLRKLNLIGIRGIALDWFCSYLRNRKQVVELSRSINGTPSTFRSSMTEIVCGVPQGSILGPLLFAIYINDLVTILHPSAAMLYADDVNILVCGTSQFELETNLNATVKKLKDWISENKLLFNIEKTKLLNFHLSNRTTDPLPTPVNCNFVNYSTNVKLLGVTITDNFTWDIHITSLNKKLNAICFALYRLSGCVSRDTLLSVYFAKFYSLLSFGIIFWGSSRDSISTFRIQKKAIRTIFNLSYRSSCKEIFKLHRCLPLPCIYIYRSILYVRKYKYMFIATNDVHNYTTRQASNVFVIRNKYAGLQKSAYSMCCKLYNKLPTDIKNIICDNQFKRAIFNLLVRKSYYHVDEYLCDIL